MATVPTILVDNTSYTNVTGGQRVEGYTNGSSVDIVSGGLATSIVITAVSSQNSAPFCEALIIAVGYQIYWWSYPHH
jgi:hypothetical protein